MLSPKLIEGDRGRITASQIQSSINPDDIHYPITSLVVLENTMNKGGGSIYQLGEIEAIRGICKEKGLKTHLDGARLFNALVESNDDPKAYGKCFDTISICFSKGLGAPVGSALLGSKEIIKEAKRVRKVFGGGMRQSGYLAAACIYALDNNVERLKEDHSKAKTIGQALKELSFVDEVMPVDTNIVIAKLDEHHSEGWFLSELEKRDVFAVGFGKNLVRFVTHLDFSDDNLDDFTKVVKSIS
jgi:threonine aldolase